MPLSLLNQTTIVLMVVLAVGLVQARISNIKNETKTICSFFLPSFGILTHSTHESEYVCVIVRVCMYVCGYVFVMGDFHI